MIKRIGTNERLSPIVKHNGVIYLSGQLCSDETQGIQHQTTTMLEKVDNLLAEAGSDKRHILSATLYLKSMNDYADLNSVWNDWLPEGCAPARACVEAKMARESLLVEVSVIAAEKN